MGEFEKIDAIVLIGPPGCGKGTVSFEICSKFGRDYVHFSTGNFIREKLKDFSGKYLDDDIIFGFVSEKISEFSGKTVILDGLPRTISQFSKTEELFNVKKYFLFGNISNSELISRMSSRVRDGESFDKINFRLDDYDNLTKPLYDYVLDLNLGNVCEIDCSLEIDLVLKQVFENF